MIASELISDILSPLMTSDTGEAALSIMNIYHVKHLPIVNKELLLGVISEEDIIHSAIDEPIGTYELSLVEAYSKQDDHLFEVLAKMAEFNLTVIPVVDEEENYLGLITQEHLIQYYAKSFSFAEPGGIIVLEMPHNDYSLAEISRLVEAENASILSSFLSQDPNSDKVWLTLKISKLEIQNILATLERFEYKIKASFSESDYIDGIKDRYEALMNYLNV